MRKTELKKIGEQFFRMVENCQTRMELQRMFRELGFKKVTSSSDAYLNMEAGYVVKFPFLPNECKGFLPKWAIPTYSRELPEKDSGFFPWKAQAFMVQPIADTSRKACNKFQDKAEKKNWSYDLCGDDCHSGNYGMYKGKPVVFDW